MRPKLLGEAPTQEIPNYNEQLRTIAEDSDLPSGALTERSLTLATEFIGEIRQSYGDPTSENYKHYHNENHALKTVRHFWMLWKPLWEGFPERFDFDGFKLGMLATAGHDLVNDAEAAVHQPGRNEQQSAQLVGERMQAAGYEEPAVQRVADAIIKTTAQRTPDGVIKQTFIREGSKDILGLCVGQADMNGILIEGPGELFSDAYALYLECSQTPLMNVLTNPRGTIDALRDEKEYLASRVAALPGDLAYYVADPTEREAIKQIYYQEFSSVSRAALEVAERLHGAPEKTREVVSSSFSWAGRVAQRGLSQVVAAERHMLDQVKRDDD